MQASLTKQSPRKHKRRQERSGQDHTSGGTSKKVASATRTSTSGSTSTLLAALMVSSQVSAFLWLDAHLFGLRSKMLGKKALQAAQSQHSLGEIVQRNALLCQPVAPSNSIPIQRHAASTLGRSQPQKKLQRRVMQLLARKSLAR